MRVPTDEDYKWAVQDMISNADRKLLAEFIGERFECTVREYEEINEKTGESEWYVSPTEYDRIGTTRVVRNKRPFTTWSDLGAVKEKMVERGEWEGFVDYVGNQDTHHESAEFESILQIFAEMSSWLFTPARFCQLAAEWLKEGKG